MSSVGLLLDSDILAEIRKSQPDPKVIAFLRRRSYRVMYISVLSLGELKGIFPVAETESWITELLDRFSGHVLEIDAQVSLCWAGRSTELIQRASLSPHAQTTVALEGLIAATASIHELEIVSAKADIYRSWGVAASNPFEEE